MPSFVGMYIEASNLPTLESVQAIFGLDTTWERVQGRFTLASGSATDTRNETKSFTTSSTGGEYNHKLSVSELASHSHSYTTLGSSGTFLGAGRGVLYDGSTGTSSAGGNGAHNNMPPYLVVDKWHRIA